MQWVQTIAVVLFALPVAALRAQSPASQPSTADLARMSTRQIIRQAARDLGDGRFASAAALYDESQKRIEDPLVLSRIAYNKALAHFQAKEFNEAISAFNQSLVNADASLTNQVGMNLGECKYQLADAARANPETLPDALELATAARDFFRSVSREDAHNANARARLRDSAKMMAEIRKQMEEQKQEQQQNGDQDKDDEQKKDEQSSQPASQPQDQHAGDESKEKQDQKQGQQSKDKKEGKEEQQSGKNKEEKQDGKDAQQAKAGDKDKNGEDDAQQGQPMKLTMSKEEAQRLLQLIRDKQRKRREQQQKLEQQRAKSLPVDKDW